MPTIRLPGAAFAALFSPLLLAQAPEAPDVPLLPSAAVTTDELGRPIAIGPDWEAEFDAEGARFLPVLGRVSPVLLDLRLRAAAIRRGGAELVLAAEVQPEVQGDEVHYRRAPGVVEQFTATPAGLEHSLVLARPVGAGGDLVVRVALGGYAAPHGRAVAGGAHLFSQGQGGVHYGSLVGIDANGVRCPGSVRLADGALEWTLPAAFVDRAQWPLLLDPLVGSNFQITVPLAGTPGNPYETDADSDLAYDVSTNTYLLVWQRRYNASSTSTTTSIRGQRLDGNGQPLGSVLALSVVDTARKPRVANVNPSNRYAVTWVMDFFGESQLRYRAVDASTGSLSTTLYLAGEPTGQLAVGDVAGETGGSAGTTPRSWVVYVDRFGNLQCILVDLPAGSTSATVAGNFTLQTNANVNGPIAICSGPSAFGRLGVVATNGLNLVLTCFNRAGVLAHASSVVYTNPYTGGIGVGRSFHRVAIDGGGSGPTDFVIAVESVRTAPTSPAGNATCDALAASSHFGTLTTTPPVFLASGISGFRASPSVAWRSGKAYVAHRALSGGIELRGLDPQTCATCEGPLAVFGSTSLLYPTEPAVCIAGSTGDGLGTRGLLVWTANIDSTGVSGPLFGRRFDVFSTLAATTSLGGGCGGGGSMQPTSMPYVGNTNFGLQLLFAEAGSLLAVLNWNSPQPLFGCGGCQWLPFGGTITTPVIGSQAQVALPIPCDATLSGVPLDAQWTVWRPGVTACPIVPDFVLSNALRLHIH
ncbi:MAG: hypothetical protein KF830_17910 [Planctomycetes bacterium]|nr:hypothetical protein [Planctomycetota bacterium]